MFKRLREKMQSVENNDSGIVRWIYQKTFSAKDRVSFYENLAFLLDNDKTIKQAFSDMRDVATDFGKKHSPYAVLLTDCISSLDEGQDAFELVLLEWIPEQEAVLIMSGLEAGDVETSLRQVCKIVKGKAEINQAVINSISYPGFLIFLVLLMMSLIYDKFIPQLAKLVPREKWDGALKYLTVISEFFIDNKMLLLLLAIIIGVFIYWSMGNWKERRWADNLMPWSIYRSIQGVYFLFNISALLKVNTPILKAMKTISATSSPWLEIRIHSAIDYLNQGQHIGLALKSTGYNFPSKDCVNQMVLLTEGKGAENILEKYAEHWFEETVSLVKRKTRYLTGFCLCLVFSFMIMLVLATSELNNLVNQMG